jgi:lipopolysaccharide transport system ATP-binding protein
VLFVSHNLDAVRRLCPRAVMLERGQVVADGATKQVLARYLARGADRAAPGSWTDLSAASRTGTGRMRFTRVRYTSGDASTGGCPHPDGPLEFTLGIASEEDRLVDSLAVTIRTQTGLMLVNADIVWRGQPLHLNAGANVVRLRIDELHLNPGVYVVSLWLGHQVGETFDYIETALEIEVIGIEESRGGTGITQDGIVSCRFDVAHVGRDDQTGGSR